MGSMSTVPCLCVWNHNDFCNGAISALQSIRLFRGGGMAVWNAGWDLFDNSMTHYVIQFCEAAAFLFFFCRLTHTHAHIRIHTHVLSSLGSALPFPDCLLTPFTEPNWGISINVIPEIISDSKDSKFVVHYYSIINHYIFVPWSNWSKACYPTHQTKMNLKVCV